MKLYLDKRDEKIIEIFSTYYNLSPTAFVQRALDLTGEKCLMELAEEINDPEGCPPSLLPLQRLGQEEFPEIFGFSKPAGSGNMSIDGVYFELLEEE